MIEVSVRYSQKEGFTGMKITGHANYNPGNDVVCAGVSALGYALVGTLNNIKGLKFVKNVVTDVIEVRIVPVDNRAIRHTVNVVFETVLIGLKQIALGYPEHLKVLK